jgi:hypothetical protein
VGTPPGRVQKDRDRRRPGRTAHVVRPPEGREPLRLLPKGADRPSASQARPRPLDLCADSHPPRPGAGAKSSEAGPPQGGHRSNGAAPPARREPGNRTRAWHCSRAGTAQVFLTFISPAGMTLTPLRTVRPSPSLSRRTPTTQEPSSVPPPSHRRDLAADRDYSATF